MNRNLVLRKHQQEVNEEFKAISVSAIGLSTPCHFLTLFDVNG